MATCTLIKQRREILDNHRTQEAETENMWPLHLEGNQELFLALQKPAGIF
jgi:hypothetical protein